jgi:hypothetical protein
VCQYVVTVVDVAASEAGEDHGDEVDSEEAGLALEDGSELGWRWRVKIDQRVGNLAWHCSRWIARWTARRNHHLLCEL